MRGPRHGNGRPHISGRKNTDPLRKIVSTKFDEYDQRVEILECGHEQPQRQDMIGPTNAYKRRCRKCRDCCGAAQCVNGPVCVLPKDHPQHLHKSAGGGTWSPIAVGARAAPQSPEAKQ